MIDPKRDYEIPEEGVAVAEVGILMYLRPDGRPAYALYHAGDVHLSTLLGTMQLAAQDLMEIYHPGPRETPE